VNSPEDESRLLSKSCERLCLEVVEKVLLHISDISNVKPLPKDFMVQVKQLLGHSPQTVKVSET